MSDSSFMLQCRSGLGKGLRMGVVLDSDSYSGTVIGLKCKDGLILAVENLLISKMLVPNSNRKIFTIGTHLGIALTGRSRSLCGAQVLLES